MGLPQAVHIGRGYLSAVWIRRGVVPYPFIRVRTDLLVPPPAFDVDSVSPNPDQANPVDDFFALPHKPSSRN